jgi:hypothetical protein
VRATIGLLTMAQRWEAAWHRAAAPANGDDARLARGGRKVA